MLNYYYHYHCYYYHYYFASKLKIEKKDTHYAKQFALNYETY